MKKFLFVLTALFALSAGAVDNVHVNLTSNPLGATYTAAFPQLTLSGLVAKSHFGIVNTASGAICCNVVTPSPVNAPSVGNGNERCFPAATEAFLDFVSISANVYCRSLSGSLSSGTLDVWTW